MSIPSRQRRQWHRDRWLRNRAFLRTLPVDYCDWALTAALYAALHAVESLLAFDNLPAHVSHDARARTLSQGNRYTHIWRHYRVLYDASQVARYTVDPRAWIEPDDIRNVLIGQHFREIEASVLKLTGDKDPPPPLHWPDPHPGK